ncbi:MAG: tRNA epoxyqueuosine(34) reductase QueG [gamma proteobacterium symbiont of Bathyaustriella thionipta]|nr:tRNA epoxyqueuosine(34) reductase QueG [gamma proteobacterium symbiont of Bathyaustriella thionipta]
MDSKCKPHDWKKLAADIKHWSRALGFQQTGICDIQLSQAHTHLQHWLQQGFHGEMAYMQKHAALRADPHKLHAGVKRIISVRMNYLPQSARHIEAALQSPQQAFISRYALGRDYHKMMRQRLQKLAKQIQQQVGEFGYRAFVDSAPVLEKAVAEKAGLGWIGKHSNLLNRSAGSWFFLGELFTDLPLPVDTPLGKHCGECVRCMEICPTQAIVAPYQVDARRCISYLTIELHSAIPTELRAMLGNRIYGCDDCQLVCPWNRFARISEESDFQPRHGLDSRQLCQLFAWSEETFLRNTEGSAIRRIGHVRWLRNIAVALGNAPSSAETGKALLNRAEHPSELVREHVLWALSQQQLRSTRT